MNDYLRTEVTLMKQILLAFMVFATTHYSYNAALKKSEPLVWAEERLANNNGRDNDNSEPFKPREYIRKKLYPQERQEK
jgi:hypothetical protein